ncbi:hypothetical protein LINPERHAP2_LOCUS38648 [Linum perenne]
MIDNRTFFVEYDSRENICITCGYYGHKADCCPTVLTPQPPPSQTEVEAPPSSSIPEDDTGEWMIVQRRTRNKAKKVSAASPEPTASGSQFDVLSRAKEKVSRANPPSEPLQEARDEVSDDVTTTLASQLAAVLAQASCMQKEESGKNTHRSPHPTPHQPLSDVTNVFQQPNSKGNVHSTNVGGEDDSTVLVNVPVVYDNPAFQGATQAAKTPRVKKQIAKREKEANRREKPDISARKEGKNDKQVRSFVPHFFDIGVVSKAGKPPDKQ